ncbi:MAG: hypothetical protein JRI44_09705 [Deltaproteobacteria bacterium]|nr:hypothetical protein [Deltaproteobacteria bacterium]
MKKEKEYRIILYGIKEKRDEKKVVKRLSSLFKWKNEEAKWLISYLPISLGRSFSLNKAKKIKELIEEVGGVVNIEIADHGFRPIKKEKKSSDNKKKSSFKLQEDWRKRYYAPPLPPLLRMRIKNRGVKIISIIFFILSFITLNLPAVIASIFLWKFKEWARIFFQFGFILTASFSLLASFASLFMGVKTEELKWFYIFGTNIFIFSFMLYFFYYLSKKKVKNLFEGGIGPFYLMVVFYLVLFFVATTLIYLFLPWQIDLKKIKNFYPIKRKFFITEKNNKDYRISLEPKKVPGKGVELVPTKKESNGKLFLGENGLYIYVPKGWSSYKKRILSDEGYQIYAPIMNGENKATFTYFIYKIKNKKIKIKGKIIYDINNVDFKKLAIYILGKRDAKASLYDIDIKPSIYKSKACMVLYKKQIGRKLKRKMKSFVFFLFTKKELFVFIYSARADGFNERFNEIKDTIAKIKSSS